MLFSAYPDSSIRWQELLPLARHIEETGWDGIWVSDHFMPNEENPVDDWQEAWTTLAALSATVPRVRLGTLVTGNTYRHPAVLAKMAATVDVISGGRLVLGLGAAWQENEHLAYGIPFHTTADRLRRLEEACRVILNLFTNEKTTLDGRYYQLTDAPLSPKPTQRPRPPLLIGGGGERVTMRIAAKYADEWNVAGTPKHFSQKTEELDRHCASIGRDPYDIRRSAYFMVSVTDTPDLLVDYSNVRLPVISGSAHELRRVVQQYQDAGADELVIATLSRGDVQLERDQYDRFMREVVPSIR